MTTLAALAAATIAPPDEGAIPPALEPAIRVACAGAWRAIEVVLAGDVLRGRLSKTRDAIVRDAVEGVLGLHGKTGIRADALASLRAARDAGMLDDSTFDAARVVEDVRRQGAVAVGRGAVASIRHLLADYRELEQALGDNELAALLVDSARAIFRNLARDPELTRWAIGPTGSPGRDRALAAFAELAASPESLAELETLIAIPIHLDDNVQFTVYRPRAIDPGKWHQLLAFAHLADRRPGEDDLPDPVEEVQRQAASVLGDKAKHYQPVIQDAGAAIPEEGELTFVPEFPGIEVNPPRRSFLWLETVHREEFRIRAPRELDGKTVRGRVTVFLGHIAIAEVACTVRVDGARPEPQKREPTFARAYRKIFASYSHRDIEIVNQFETYARALGDEYLRDWVHLRTGEVWTDRLCQLIEQADAFQLFWSWNSMHSQFVRQEYEHALSLNRPSFVRPTYWEDPMPAAPGLPPESLLRLHFQKLGAAMLGDAGRTEAALAKKREKARPPEPAKAEVRREEVAMERESGPSSLGDTDPYGRPPAEADVTDPQYTLPEADAESSATDLHVVESTELRRRKRSVSTPPDPDPTEPRAIAAPGRARVPAAGRMPEPQEPPSMRRSNSTSPPPASPAPSAPSRPSPAPVAPRPGPPSRPSPTPAPSAQAPSIPRSIPAIVPRQPGPAARPAPGPMPAAPAPSSPAPSSPAPSSPAPAKPRPAPAPMASPPGPAIPMAAPAEPSRLPAAASAATTPGQPALDRIAAAASAATTPDRPALDRIAADPSRSPAAPGRPDRPLPAAASTATTPGRPALDRLAANSATPGRPALDRIAAAPTAPSPMQPVQPAFAGVGPSPAPSARPVFGAAPTAPRVALDDDESPTSPREHAATDPGIAPAKSVVSRDDVSKQLEQRAQPAFLDAAEPRLTTQPGVGPTKIPHTNPHASPPPPRPSAITCTSCGHKNAPDVAFCLHCGSDLVGSPAAIAKAMEMSEPVAFAETPVMGSDVRPPRPTEAAPMPPPPGPMGNVASPGMAAHGLAPISPYAPTIPQESYKPAPGELLPSSRPESEHPHQFDAVSAMKTDAPAWRPSMPDAPRRSILPWVLMIAGALIVLAVILVWLLG